MIQKCENDSRNRCAHIKLGVLLWKEENECQDLLAVSDIEVHAENWSMKGK
jgi:hypothetical protein